MFDRDIKELYQEFILDNAMSPKNFRIINDDFCKIGNGFNALCGDKVIVYVLLENDLIKDISFMGEGCAISKASASIMTMILINKSIDEVRSIFKSFHGMVIEGDQVTDFDKLNVFSNVFNYPSRVKCAILCWHTMVAAIESGDEVAINM